MTTATYDYAYDQLCDAVAQLASNELPVPVRLGRAARLGMSLRRKDLPPDAWTRLQLLLNTLTHGLSDGDEDALSAGLSHLSEDEARRCTKEFVAVFNIVSTQHVPTTH